MKKNKIIIYIICAFIMAFFTKEFNITSDKETNVNINSTKVQNTTENIQNTNNEYLKVHIIDVGQADSIFIELPNEQSLLIDAGNNSDDEIIVDYINNLQYDKIDYVVGTHPHEDHIGGLDTVINTFNIGKVYLPKVENNTKTFEDMLLAVKNKNLKINTAVAGVKIIDTENLKVQIISPQNKIYEDFNYYSAVVKIEYLDNSFILMGDAEKINESEITDDVNADVIKIGHHGSDTSSSEQFLQKVSPDYAIISVGENNKYGHPNDATLNLLNEMNINVVRTDESGTITVISDGKNIEVEKSK
ncbi:MAG: hydrolase [Bacillota bacterium]|nr:hydrolase [Bacillota bacterium]